MLDGLGNVLGRQAHLPFGEDFAESGTQEKHHFTSYERDGEAGTDYAVNRQYAQNVGRFNQVDPVAPPCTLTQILNRYSYAGNDPINAFDPDGRVTVCNIFATGKIYLSMGGDGWALIGTFIVTRCEDIQVGNESGGGGGGGRPKLSREQCKAKIGELDQLNKKNDGLHNDDSPFAKLKALGFEVNGDEALRIFRDFRDAYNQFESGIANGTINYGTPTFADWMNSFGSIGSELGQLLTDANRREVRRLANEGLNDLDGANQVADEIGYGCKDVNLGREFNERRDNALTTWVVNRSSYSPFFFGVKFPGL